MLNFCLIRPESNWDTLVAVLNNNGATLKGTEQSQGISLEEYVTIDTDSDGVMDDYYFIFEVAGVPDEKRGKVIEVRPSGIERWTK